METEMADVEHGLVLARHMKSSAAITSTTDHQHIRNDNDLSYWRSQLSVTDEPTTTITSQPTEIQQQHQQRRGEVDHNNVSGNDTFPDNDNDTFPDNDNNTTNNNNNNNSNDGVEAIVRNAARTVRNLRAALIVLIVAATISCGILIYKLSSKNETDSFQYSFDDVATKLTHSFTLVLFENLNYGYIMSVSLSSRLYVDSDYTPAFPNVSIYDFDTLTWAVRNHGLFTSMLWSPLLYTTTQRQSWEEYAMSKLPVVVVGQNGSVTAGGNSNAAPFPPCYMCGEGNEIVNIHERIAFPGIGTFTCEEINLGALAGYISPEECSFFQPVWQPTCGCQKSSITTNATSDNNNNNNSSETSFIPGIFRLDTNGNAVMDQGPPPYSPIWQISPSGNTNKIVMYNQMSEPWRRNAVTNMMDRKTPVLSKIFHPDNEGLYKLGSIPTFGPAASMIYPVFESIQSDHVVGSFVFDLAWERFFSAMLPSRADGITIVLENTMGQALTFRVANNIVDYVGQDDFHETTFDSMMVESSYDDFDQLLMQGFPRAGIERSSVRTPTCTYRIRVYPSEEFRLKHVTNKPIIYTLIVVLAFGLTSFVFFSYDRIVRRIQNKVLNSAKRSEEIVSSLFPDLVRERLFGGTRDNHQTRSVVSRFGLWTGRKGVTSSDNCTSLHHNKARLRTYLSHPPTSLDVLHHDLEPIADLYPNTTVLFADIAGFTAWSSEREPPQVFQLLESLYSEFDEVARELGVFKVETIGDCYVAVTGLPEKMKFHAIVMVEFAFRCLVRMQELLSKLELILGPGTADLSIRIGLHSGPVTAGVLRGDRARFQLFGDTVNVASRMESTGKPNKVHISQETANRLMEAGFQHWVVQRQESVSVKGKGQMQTYWAKPSSMSPTTDSLLVNPKNAAASSDDGGGFGENSIEGNRCRSRSEASQNEFTESGVCGGATSSLLWNTLDMKPSAQSVRNRLVEWNAELLQSLLQKVVAKRHTTITTSTKSCKYYKASSSSSSSDLAGAASSTYSDDIQFLDEITEAIEVPEFDERNIMVDNPPPMDLGPAVRTQLRGYVSHIASLYRDKNAFHNFEHACHVAMSASKLLKRIISPDDLPLWGNCSNNNNNESSGGGSGKAMHHHHHHVVSKEIHDSTFGISSDPLMQFAVLFSALIHDVDHTGLTNRQLVQENDPLAIKYHGKCVAEQHSIQLAWDTLMKDEYVDFRHCIFQTHQEQQRFRQLLVNAVIATDIADQELSTWRKHRWDKVFHPEASVVATTSTTNAAVVVVGESNSNRMISDRKATIVFEYIIQASDVAHTMQHWHIYQKWNKRLFDERYSAYRAGREADDPSLHWYKGEMDFLDNYIIPLAKKLEECHVFGVSCDEYLSYAIQNRNEWAMKGEGIVRDMLASQQQYGIQEKDDHNNKSDDEDDDDANLMPNNNKFLEIIDTSLSS